MLIEIEFAKVIEVIYSFLNPVFEAVVNENEMFETWNPSLLKYEKNF